jgi:hypothetical protein
MIPSSKILRKQVKKLKLLFDLDKKDYFKLTFEYIELKQIFSVDDFMDKTILLIDMFIQPLYIFYKMLSLEFSLLDSLSLMKSYELWLSYIRFVELRSLIKEWKFMVQLVNGPWISCNDSLYHELVYADAMTRITEVYQKID